MGAVREYVGQGETIIYINEYCEKSRNFPNRTKKQCLKIEKYKENLVSKGVSFEEKSVYGETVFNCFYVYQGERATGQRIKKYERLLKQQKIRFRKTMDNVKATFTWDTAEVSFL